MWVERAATVRAQGTEAVSEASMERWFTDGFRQSQPRVVERFKAMIESQPAEGYANLCGVLERIDLSDDLGRISAPTLVISGAQDPSTPPDGHGKLIAEGIPGARFEVLDPAAHLAAVERADVVTDLILDHLEGKAS
jgi:3-oxoadipate enol-lactonase